MKKLFAVLVLAACLLGWGGCSGPLEVHPNGSPLTARKVAPPTLGVQVTYSDDVRPCTFSITTTPQGWFYKKDGVPCYWAPGENLDLMFRVEFDSADNMYAPGWSVIDRSSGAVVQVFTTSTVHKPGDSNIPNYTLLPATLHAGDTYIIHKGDEDPGHAWGFVVTEETIHTPLYTGPAICAQWWEGVDPFPGTWPQFPEIPIYQGDSEKYCWREKDPIPLPMTIEVIHFAAGGHDYNGVFEPKMLYHATAIGR